MGLLSKRVDSAQTLQGSKLADLAVSRFAHDLAAPLSSLAMSLETMESPLLPPTERDLTSKIARQALKQSMARLALWRLAFSLSQATQKPSHDIITIFDQLLDAMQVEGKLTFDEEDIDFSKARLICKIILAFSMSLSQKACRIAIESANKVIKLKIQGERVVLPPEYTLCIHDVNPDAVLNQRTAFFLIVREQLNQMNYGACVTQATSASFEIHFIHQA